MSSLRGRIRLACDLTDERFNISTMERTRYTVVLTFAFLMLLSPACVAQQKTISDTEKLLLDSANRERTDRGLPLLTWDEALGRAARKHAELMAEQDALAHQLADERDLTTRAREAGARFSRITENIGRGADASKFHDGWMHSPGIERISRRRG